MRWSFPTIVLAPRGGRAAPPTFTDRQRVFRWAAATGFEGVELSPRWIDLSLMSSGELKGLANELRDHGLRVSGFNINRCLTDGHYMDGRHESAAKERERIAGVIEQAHQLDAEIVNLSLAMPTLPGPERPPVRGSEFSADELAQLAGAVAELVGRAGPTDGHCVKISLELHDDGPLDTPERCLNFLKEVERSYGRSLSDGHKVGINPDVGNICRGPGPLPDWRGAFKTLAPHANNWHVKNYSYGGSLSGPTDGHYEPAALWEGEIDYEFAWAVMRGAGYDGWVSVESYYGEPFDQQARSLAYLKELDARIPASVARASPPAGNPGVPPAEHSSP